MKRVVAWILKYKKTLSQGQGVNHQTVQLKDLHQLTLMCHYLNNAQQEVIRLHQQQVSSEEIDHLRDGNTGDQKS